jgi:hypothetical protein
MYDPIETVNYKSYTIEVYPDDCPENPRTAWDNVGTMVCFHSRYNLGDEDHGYPDADAVLDHLRENMLDWVWLPLHLYDHSGITMNTTGFYCPWDSGQVGIIMVERKEAIIEWGLNAGDRDIDKQIMERLNHEVQVYDHYISGMVYGYVVKDQDDDEIDSCWGFYGDPDDKYMIDQAKDAIDHDEQSRFPLLAYAGLVA